LHIDERNPVQERVDLMVIGVIAIMLAEMLFQLGGANSFWALMWLGAVCVFTLRGIYFQRGWVLLVLTTGAYSVSAYFSGRSYGVVQNDLYSIFQAAVLSVFLSPSHFSVWRRARFWLLLHRSFLFVGGAAAVVGLTKLVLMNRGVTLDFFLTSEGVYPPGSSLNSDYNVFSVALIMTMGSALWLLNRDRSHWIYLICHISLPIMVTCVLLTSSRRALVFLSIGASAAFFTRIWRRRRGSQPARPTGNRSRWVIGATYAIVVSIAATNIQTLAARVQDFFLEEEVQSVTTRAKTVSTSEAAESRLIYWQASVQKLSQHTPFEWLFGSGFGYVRELGVGLDVVEDYPHNFVLSALLYGGLFQTILTIILVVQAHRQAWFAGADHRILVFWLLMLTAFHLTSSNSVFSAEIFLVLMALSLDTTPSSLTLSRRGGTGRMPARNFHRPRVMRASP
jgi:hypothetical protein